MYDSLDISQTSTDATIHAWYNALQLIHVSAWVTPLLSVISEAVYQAKGAC